ncbi:MAG TPA: CBS domain-containing protein [Candidatus Binatia bacterium]|nr:CBS domain-containing protein [Candidatus Binatia bacterium]
MTNSPERSIAEACWIMTDKNIGRLVAEDQGKVCRILPDRDRAEGDREDKEPLATMVEEVMTRDPVRISVSRNIRDGCR